MADRCACVDAGCAPSPASAPLGCCEVTEHRCLVGPVAIRAPGHVLGAQSCDFGLYRRSIVEGTVAGVAYVRHTNVIAGYGCTTGREPDPRIPVVYEGETFIEAAN